MRIGSVSGIAGGRDSSLIRPVPDAETFPTRKQKQRCQHRIVKCDSLVYQHRCRILHTVGDSRVKKCITGCEWTNGQLRPDKVTNWLS